MSHTKSYILHYVMNFTTYALFQTNIHVTYISAFVKKKKKKKKEREKERSIYSMHEMQEEYFCTFYSLWNEIDNLWFGKQNETWRLQIIELLQKKQECSFKLILQNLGRQKRQSNLYFLSCRTGTCSGTYKSWWHFDKQSVCKSLIILGQNLAQNQGDWYERMYVTYV